MKNINVNVDDLVSKIISEISKSNEIDPKNININTKLYGSDAIIKSRQLFELLLFLENYLVDYEIDFDWPSMMINKIDNHPASTIKSLSEYILK